jgi:uncharacterized membrane protein YtjA (UPF0391 family)
LRLVALAAIRVSAGAIELEIDVMRAPGRVNVAGCCRRERDSARPNYGVTKPVVCRAGRNPNATPSSVVEPVPSLEVRSAIFCTSRGSGGPQAGVMGMTILKWALIFFLVSIVAGILGFTGVSAASADIARFLFYVFVVIFLVLLILGLTIFRV